MLHDDFLILRAGWEHGCSAGGSIPRVQLFTSLQEHVAADLEDVEELLPLLILDVPGRTRETSEKSHSQELT